MILKNLQWKKDQHGDYWKADLFSDDNLLLGVTGSYLSVEENDQRLTKEEQLKFIEDNYIVE